MSMFHPLDFIFDVHHLQIPVGFGTSTQIGATEAYFSWNHLFKITYQLKDHFYKAYTFYDSLKHLYPLWGHF